MCGFFTHDHDAADEILSLAQQEEISVDEIENNIADSLDKEIPWLREDLMKFAKDIVTTLLTTYHITKREGK